MVTAVRTHRLCRPTSQTLRHWGGRFTAAMLALAAFAPAVRAQEGLTPHVSFDGFGTLGIAHSTEEAADFVENPTRSRGAGYSSTLGESVDSRFGGQLTVQAGPSLTGVLQIVMEQNTDGEYRPTLEWANLRYSFTPDLSVRAGRIVLPLFMVSETRKVSFANPWVRPPVEMYGMIPIYRWDGVDASYRRRIGEWTSTVNTAVGRASSDIPGGRAEADLFWSSNATMIRGEFTGRLAIARGEVTINTLDPLFDGFRAFGPEGEAIADRYSPEDTPMNFASAGVEYNPGPWFTMAELGWLHSESVMGERLGGYITGGYRWGSVSPFVTLSRVDVLSDTSAAGLTTTGMPPEYAQPAAQLNAGLNMALSGHTAQQNLAFGARWDVFSGVALKAQVDLIDPLGQSEGTFTNHQPTFEPGGSSQLFSVAATFVF